MLALRAAITLRHSCWGLGRNRSRGWELDCGSMETFAYHDVGSDFTLFRFLYTLFPSTYWLWELVRERHRRWRILGLDWEGPRRIRPSGMAWLLSARSSLLGKGNPPLIPSCSRVKERTDIRTDGSRGN